MNIIEKLKSFNVEITAEIEKAFAGEFVSEREMEKKLSKLQTENETLKERAETAEETLKGFDGKNFDEITKERDEWKRKAEDAEKNVLTLKNLLTREQFTDIPVEEAGKIILESKN